MSRKKKQRLIVGAVLLLSALNIWRWWPSHAEGSVVGVTEGRVLTPTDFRVHGMMPAGSERNVARNLFIASAPEPLAPEFVPVVPAPARPAVREVEEAPVSRTHLAEYQLEGTLAHAGRTKAFLSKMDVQYHVEQGDRLDDGTVVVRIEPEHVVLRSSLGEQHMLRLDSR